MSSHPMAMTPDKGQLTELLIRRAGEMLPAIRSRAKGAEARRAVHQETIEDAVQAGLMQALTPARFGGPGLGLDALCEVARVLAQGDASTAWTIAFMMEHNWMAGHLSLEAQESLFSERPYILAAAPLLPSGAAQRVPGGFRVSGTWRYASAAGNSDWVFVSSLVQEAGEGVSYSFLIPMADVVLNDDWFMSGMAATSSCSITGKDVFVPERMSIETELFHSTHDHPGAHHEEPLYRYPILQSLFSMMSAIMLGAAQGAVELGRERLPQSAPWGVPRLDRETGRIRWGVAHQKVRCAELLYRQQLDFAILKGDAEAPWTLVEEGQMYLDLVAIGELCADAVRLLLDGAGSSAFQLDNPLQRCLRDVDVMANHIAFDRDVVHERGSRWLLGLGRSPNDPFPPRRYQQ